MNFSLTNDFDNLKGGGSKSEKGEGNNTLLVKNLGRSRSNNDLRSALKSIKDYIDARHKNPLKTTVSRLSGTLGQQLKYIDSETASAQIKEGLESMSEEYGSDEVIDEFDELLDGAILYDEVGSLAGLNKIGKSRGFIALLAYAVLAVEKNKNLKIGILSTENPKKMLLPYIKSLKASNNIKVCNPRILTDFSNLIDDKETFKGKVNVAREDANEFLKRIQYVIERHAYNLLFIDPFPRILEWNDSKIVEYFLNGLKKITADTKCIIFGTINDSKKTDQRQEHKASGSHVITANLRVNLRANEISPGSQIWKEHIKSWEEKNIKDVPEHELGYDPKVRQALYITSQYSTSYMTPTAYIIVLRTVPVEYNVRSRGGDVKPKDVYVGKAEVIAKIQSREALRHIEFYTSNASGKPIRALVMDHLTKNKFETMINIKNAFPMHDGESVYKCVKRMVKDGTLLEKKDEDDDGNEVGANFYSIKKGNSPRETPGTPGKKLFP